MIGIKQCQQGPQVAMGILVALIALLGGYSSGRAQETGKIHFLTFQLTNGVLVLTKSAVVPGTLKPDPVESPLIGLRIALEKGPDTSVWSRRIQDPAVVRLEYEDPDQPGAIKFKTVTVKDTEFVVRAPYYREARHVAVFREESSPVTQGTNAPAMTRTLMLRAALPVEETK